MDSFDKCPIGKYSIGEERNQSFSGQKQLVSGCNTGSEIRSLRRTEPFAGAQTNAPAVTSLACVLKHSLTQIASVNAGLN